MSPKMFVGMLAVFALPALAAENGTVIPVSFAATQTYGMVGLAHGQTARLNLLNLGVIPSPIAANPAAPACAAQIDFLDDQGQLLKSQVLTVPPGKSLSLDLNYDTDLVALAPRFEIRVDVRIPPQAGGILPPVFAGCSLIPSFEIFNNSDNKTVLIIAGPRLSYGPIPLTASPGM